MARSLNDLTGFADIQKRAEATRRPGETPEVAFTRYLESHPGVIAEMGCQAALAKRRAAGPLASLPDPAYDALLLRAERMVADGASSSVAQAFAKLYEAHDPNVRRLVKAAKVRAAAALGATLANDDEDADAVLDPVDGGDADPSDYGVGGDLDDRGTQGATGQGRNRGRAKMFSEIMPTARPVATARTEGSYDPRKRPPSATRAAPSSATSRSYARPAPATFGKRGSPAGGNTDPKILKRIDRFVTAFPHASTQEVLHYATAPQKVTRRAILGRMAKRAA
jgi:hypothetical protein